MSLAFFVKPISESNVIDERQQISPEFCQPIPQTTQENKWVKFRKFCPRQEKTANRR